MTSEVFQVVLIDDQVSYMEGFSAALAQADEFEVVGTAADAETGLALCASLQPHLAVSDYRLPGDITGADVARRLRLQGFIGPILILTGFHAPQVAREISGLERVYSTSKDESIRRIAALMSKLVRGARPADARENSVLSEGEMAVLELLNQGRSPTEVSEELFLSLHAVRARIKSMYRKLGVERQGEAIAVATRQGLLVPPR